MGVVFNMDIGKMINVCKYKASDISEIPKKLLEPDGRWSQYSHWEVGNDLRRAIYFHCAFRTLSLQLFNALLNLNNIHRTVVSQLSVLNRTHPIIFRNPLFCVTRKPETQIPWAYLQWRYSKTWQSCNCISGFMWLDEIPLASKYSITSTFR